MYCNKCGKQIPDGSEFCNFCGTRVSTEPETEEKSTKDERNDPSRDTIIVECNPHWIMAYKPLLLIVVFVVLGIFVSPFFFIAVPLIIIFMVILLKSVKLYLTADTVVGKKGIINTQQMTSPIRNVQDLNITDGLWGKILGYGNISISTAGTAGTEYVFKHMCKCKKFQQEFIRISGDLNRR